MIPLETKSASRANSISYGTGTDPEVLAARKETHREHSRAWRIYWRLTRRPHSQKLAAAILRRALESLE